MTSKILYVISKFRIWGFLALLTAVFFVFQGNLPSGHVFDDDNPYIDQPTREAYSHFTTPGQQSLPMTVTDAQGFDNFNISLDYCEQHASSNPQNPLWLFFGVNGSGSPQNAWHSENGGLNWTLTQPSYPGGTCCDPWSAYLSNGKLIYASGVSGQYIYTSTNNGATWTSPVLSVSGVDRNTVAAELTGTGPYAHYLYASITGSGGAPFARSTNQGASWTTTYTGTPHNLPGVMIASGPNGSTNGGCVMFVTSSGQSYAATYTFHRSLDGGASFSVVSSLTVAGYSGYYNSAGRLTVNNARHRTYPFIVMDNSNGPYRGRLYLVYSSNVPAGNGNKPDIMLQYSTNQGATWSSQIVVNDNANPTQSDQWFPSIWCEPTTGKLYIKWYDDRENPSAFTTGVWGTYSTTGGTTFAPNQRISNASWLYPCPACGANQNCYRGDYDGITANPITGFAVWYDPRSCTYQTMGSYFPDYAMTVIPSTHSITNQNDSDFSFISVPAVKLYTNSVKFSATVTPTPSAGTLAFTFLNKTGNTLRDSLTSYPDSLRIRIKATGGVTSGAYTVNILGKGPNGTPVHLRTIALTVTPVGLSSNENEVPKDFFLYQNFPNPFNPTTNIRFDIAKAGLVTLSVYDITGKKVADLVNENLNAGKHTVDFNASNISSGVYFYKIETPDFTSIKKMMLIK
jgi:hypothetical protein